MEQKKSLEQLVKETIGYTALVYPIYSGIGICYFLFVEKLKDPSTAVFASGLTAAVSDATYLGAKELYKVWYPIIISSR